MNARDEERLHQRLVDGTADPGMYPDCADHVGMIDHGDEERAWLAAQEDYERALFEAAEAGHDRCPFCDREGCVEHVQ